ncbi:MAG TPA: V-type ATP synthase subunit D [Candidatus Thermoplasmatota archaeon]|jgi:V/A-type H+/Na+-transporting ATPase subunit D|nr:V-type ATP synthase subunit D [Candidatus Thermoplasmatota archaeon]
MALKDVKPTRSQLIELKKRINLSKKGYKLLKMKRDGLIMEFFKLLEQAKKVRQEMGGRHERAEEAIHVAEAVEGLVPVKSAALALGKSPTIDLARKNVMGVVVPKIESSGVRQSLVERGYGIIGTSPRIDQAARSYEELVETIIQAAEVETSMKKMLDEIEKTKRRVNALEFKVIPELSQARDFIRLRLEEMERENIFRLKKIKAKSEAAAA